MTDAPALLKVCCIASAAEAALAVRHGATAVGLVSAMPSGPGVISEAEIAAIAPLVPAEVHSVLLTCALEPQVIADQVRRTGVTAVQLVEAQPPEVHRELRRLLPDTAIVQVVHVVEPASVEEALDVAARPEVDALLLDSGDPRAAIRTLGGTGRVHDWALSAAICRRAPARVPVFLAGGLSPDNVAEAWRRVRPSGVDVCTGVRSGGALDEARLAAFAAALRSVSGSGGSCTRGSPGSGPTRSRAR